MSVILHGKEIIVHKKKRRRRVYQTYEGWKEQDQEYLALNLTGKGIKDIFEIKGLETLVNLEELTIKRTSISEIKGLESLVNLKTLSLARNSISEIKGLDTLVNLKELFLGFNPIETLKGLDNLVNLKFLSLQNCKIHEIESFKNKESLKHLILGKNPILRDLRRAISKKNKFSRMTEEERKNAGVNPNVWEVAINYRGKLLKYMKRVWYANIF